MLEYKRDLDEVIYLLALFLDYGEGSNGEFVSGLD